MKNKKVLSGVLAAFLLFNSFGISSYAIGDGFDAEYYAEKYPDVKSAFGTNPELLWNHYVNYGIREKRFQSKWEEEHNIVNSSNIDISNTVYDTSVVNIVPASGYTTYIDVNLTLQLVTYFEDGNIKYQTPCVTGLANGKRDTPKGVYKIECKMPGKRLKGPTWDCWVNRWMRFTNTAVGFHDASWRSSFGGEIYKRNGSHGCVNLPKQAAYDLYDMVDVGTTVIVHE